MIFVRMGKSLVTFFTNVFLSTTLGSFASNAGSNSKICREIREYLAGRIVPYAPSYSICVGDADGEKHPRVSWKLTGGGNSDGSDGGSKYKAHTPSVVHEK